MNTKFMSAALEEAGRAYELGEVPIGAVVVHNGNIIGRGHNRREHDSDPTAHAEMIAIREAAAFLQNWRLTGTELYVTLEPCPMCAGAIVNARIKTVVFGSFDAKAGAIRSLMNIVQDPRLNHSVEVYDGICHDACSHLLSRFFKGLRSERG